MYAEDAADILYLAASEPRLVGEVLFAAHDEHLPVIEIANRIVRILERGRLTVIDWPEERRRIEIDSVRISSGRLRGITGWRPRFSFDDGLRRTRATLERETRS